MSGRPARRAVTRWSLRLLRREWRQHLLVVSLLTVAVAAALFGAITAYNIAPSHDAKFGLASHRFDINVEDRAVLDEFVADAVQHFGSVDVIGHRLVPVTGSTDAVAMRWQDPAGPFGAPMLGLREGRYPAAPGEVSLTDGTSRLLGADVGGTVTLEGTTATVVGIVENPDDLDEDFALFPPTPEALPDAATILLSANEDAVQSFRSGAAPNNWMIEARGQSEKTLAAVAVLAAATVAMLLVTLVAAAAFVVIAQRRQRQLGLLAAAGATERQVRLVITSGGAAVGAVAAIAGAVAALGAWFAAKPAIENAAGRRLDSLDLPWWIVAAGTGLAVVTAIAAAWWPARTIARLPVIASLSGRPPRPRRARRSLAVAVTLLCGGIACLVFAADPSKDTANPVLMIAGVVATPLGVVLLAPSLVRLVGLVARRSPLGARIATRDLARYQSRAGAAVAAISLALAIVVAIVVIAAANEADADEGNLSDRQVLIHVGRSGSPDGSALAMPELEPAEVESMGRAIDEWVETLDGAVVVPLGAAVDATRDERIDGVLKHPTVVLGFKVDENTYRDIGTVYVATPTLLDYLGTDPTTVADGTTLLTSHEGDVYLVNVDSEGSRDPVDPVQRFDQSFSSMPRALLTTEGLRSGGWTPSPAGWIVESSRPLTDDELASAREMADAAGLSVEARDEQAGLDTLRNTATAIGLAAALATLAMTVGLIRAEAAGDVRTLTAVGASSRTRRSVTAWTSATLALLAALLGMVGAYAALIAGYTPDTERLSNVPIVHLATIGVGLPIVAGVAGWLLAGRQPRLLGRQLTQ